MPRNWESIFSTWSKGPALTETQRCENSISAIRKALNQSADLNKRDIDVFLQGSYRNRVNIKQDSDVDIGIVCHNTFFYDLRNELTASELDITPSFYEFSDFKNEIHCALNAYFGASTVTRGNKAFDIKANSYRVEADVAPFFDYREYFEKNNHRDGVKLIADSGATIVNYPEQHYSNGVNKNSQNYRRYKRVVRILKNLKSDMEEKGHSSAHDVPGFLIECLVYNVPNDNFQHTSFVPLIRSILAFLFNNTMPSIDCSQWVEGNGIKFLFHITQPWTQAQSHLFISDAWNYLEFNN